VKCLRIIQVYEVCTMGGGCPQAINKSGVVTGVPPKAADVEYGCSVVLVGLGSAFSLNFWLRPNFFPANSTTPNTTSQ
jgi:hypothetical protein